MAPFAVLLCLCAAGSAQTQTPSKESPCVLTDGSKAVDAKPCPPPKALPSVSEQFPFPGETPEPKTTNDLSTPQLQAPAANPSGSKSVKDQFPFPGEAPQPAGGDGTGASSSSSADAPPDVDGKPNLKDEGTEGTTARGRRRLRPPAQKILSDDERVDEDLSVAHFYQQTGNLTGAYLRTKDAVKLQPQTAEVHFALAEVAQKLGKKDEAIAEYTRYLELDPSGDGAKTAKKALDRLKP